MHRLKQCRLGLWWGSVDLIGQDDIFKNRTGDELELAAPLGGFLQDVRTGDVHRHQVRSELNAVEPQGHGFRNLADEQGLCEAWNPHEQSVPTREQANRELFDHFSLTDDDFT